MTMTTHRAADPNHPQYVAGRAAATRTLDRGMLSLVDMLTAWRMVADTAHNREDVSRFHYAQGQVDAFEDFQADRSRRKP